MLKILRSTQEINPITREKSWNDAYKSLKIEEKNDELLNNKVSGFVEYLDILEEFFTNKDINEKEIVELACGTAPLAFYFRKKFNKHIVCSDYSQIILNRLKEDYNFKINKSDISNLSSFKDNSIDYIFLGGGFYEDPNPYFFSKVFSSLEKKIKDNGKIFIFMNRHMSLINLKSYFQSLYFCKIRPQSWNWIRKIFNKNKINYEIAVYLYSVKFISRVLPEANLTCKKINYVGHALGLTEFLKIILPKKLSKKLINSKFLFTSANFLKRKQINLLSTRCVLEVEKKNKLF